MERAHYKSRNTADSKELIMF